MTTPAHLQAGPEAYTELDAEPIQFPALVELSTGVNLTCDLTEAGMRLGVKLPNVPRTFALNLSDVELLTLLDVLQCAAEELGLFEEGDDDLLFGTGELGGPQ